MKTDIVIVGQGHFHVVWRLYFTFFFSHKWNSMEFGDDLDFWILCKNHLKYLFFPWLFFTVVSWDWIIHLMWFILPEDTHKTVTSCFGIMFHLEPKHFQKLNEHVHICISAENSWYHLMKSIFFSWFSVPLSRCDFVIRLFVCSAQFKRRFVNFLIFHLAGELRPRPPASSHPAEYECGPW